MRGCGGGLGFRWEAEAECRQCLASQLRVTAERAGCSRACGGSIVGGERSAADSRRGLAVQLALGRIQSCLFMKATRFAVMVLPGLFVAACHRSTFAASGGCGSAADPWAKYLRLRYAQSSNGEFVTDPAQCRRAAVAAHIVDAGGQPRRVLVLRYIASGYAVIDAEQGPARAGEFECVAELDEDFKYLASYCG